ncbi:MAG: cupin domain-containing protein [Candidatus Tectimicrobiota bacterium]
MRVVRLNDIEEKPLGEATPIPGWTGGSVTRTRQTIIPDGDSENYRCSVVNFSHGASTGWHAHTCDQILVVTGGTGIVATEHEQREITVGDVVHIKAGERHWHGAKANTTLSHITITQAESQSVRP